MRSLSREKLTEYVNQINERFDKAMKALANDDITIAQDVNEIPIPTHEKINKILWETTKNE